MSIEVCDIEARLGNRVVLGGASVRCGGGRVTGLVGPNGAGKSTLLRVMGGLVKPTKGHVMLGGRRIDAYTGLELGQQLAYLPQAREVHWPLTVQNLVGLGRMPHRQRAVALGADDRAAIHRAMAAMDVTALAHRPASALSGGELARVLLARALAQEADTILADEPTAGLDPAHALALFEVLGRLAREGRTIVVALHDLSLAARFCHDVVMLAAGQVAASGAAGEVLVAQRLEPVFGVRMGVGMIEGVASIVPVAARGGTGIASGTERD